VQALSADAKTRSARIEADIAASNAAADQLATDGLARIVRKVSELPEQDRHTFGPLWPGEL